ncbi:Uncharacterised protein [uncultured Clostridium sp.]|nr:Uncharacterised protein [uncultured Clostridium sp.]
MKLPFIQRKKFDAIQNKNLKLMRDKANLKTNIDAMDLECKALIEELTVLREDLKERNQELDLTIKYNDISTNKVCELNTKLIAEETKNEELEDKIKELEFCLEEAKKENRNSIEIIKRTNIVKNLLVNLTTLKDVQGRVLIENGSVLTHSKVEGNKVYDIARLLG